MPRVIFSPTTTPMLPPMNGVLHRGDHDLEAVETARSPTMTASLRPVAAIVCLQPIAVRLGVGELQRIVRGERREVLGRTRPSSNSDRRRSAALIRK